MTVSFKAEKEGVTPNEEFRDRLNALRSAATVSTVRVKAAENSSAADLISHATYRVDERPIETGVYLLPQIIDVNVDDVGDRAWTQFPCLLDDHISGHGL